MAGRISLTMPAVEPMLDAAEASLVDRALEWLRGAAPRDYAELAGQLRRVRVIATAFDQSPSLSVPSSFAGIERDGDWFAGSLSHLDPLTGELALPEKAVLARAFLATKIAFLRSCIAALADGAPGHHPELAAGFGQELAQSIYTAIATEILTDLQWDTGVGEATQVRAAYQLILVWDRALELEIDDFCPILESAWRARSHVAARYGALLGTAEYMSLVANNCPPEFLDFFAQDGPQDGERHGAFEEFLFGLTWEELGLVRAAMETAGRAVVDSAFVARALSRPLDDQRPDDPDSLYRSYRRRRTGAEFRRVTGALGPIRVAEAYLMIYLLHRS